jgi:hypothetical protein
MVRHSVALACVALAKTVWLEFKPPRPSPELVSQCFGMGHKRTRRFQ